MDIRPALPSDLPVMKQIFADAKAKMRASGNLLQWTGDYPTDETLLQDMRRGFSYIVEQEGQPIATFVLAICPDPTYKIIYEGQWLNDSEPYGTIHRIASLQGQHGIMQVVLDWASARIQNLRVDTHRDNLIMQHLLLKHGFSYCGIIYLANGDERLAYQRITDRSIKKQKYTQTEITQK